jgi:hypothetical protein
MTQTHIYALHDPRDWAIRYVGQSNNPERRHRRPRSHKRAQQSAMMKAFWANPEFRERRLNLYREKRLGVHSN